ncbi:DoxX family protein [Actinomadura hibisca]|uniref:DoxX family protein n=1 Tax=Actinomadura hibisca TaxID=68565 RepID=UPI00082ABA38|nr:DoxX family protein [Actinomadura hibisca]
MAATHTTATAAPAASSTAVRRVLWTLRVLLGAFLLFGSALPKFAGQADAMETFARLGWGDGMRYFVGAVEAAGAIGLVVPALAGLAATGLIGLMIGAAIVQVTVIEPAWAALPLAFGVVFAAVAWTERRRTRALVDLLKR